MAPSARRLNIRLYFLVSSCPAIHCIFSLTKALGDGGEIADRSRESLDRPVDCCPRGRQVRFPITRPSPAQQLCRLVFVGDRVL